jgi:hypothetical protein
MTSRESHDKNRSLGRRSLTRERRFETRDMVDENLLASK